MSRWNYCAALLPLLAAGCNIYSLTLSNLTAEPQLAWTEWVIRHELRQQARAAWEKVKPQYPDAVPEFREGFLDGYMDYLDRGGNGSPPAVPPAKYTRHPRYFTPQGHWRLQQYFAGFQLGQELAIASGQRQYLTVPVQLPPPAEEPPRFRVAPSLERQEPSGRPIDSATPAELPAPRPTPPEWKRPEPTNPPLQRPAEGSSQRPVEQPLPRATQPPFEGPTARPLAILEGSR